MGQCRCPELLRHLGVHGSRVAHHQGGDEGALPLWAESAGLHQGISYVIDPGVEPVGLREYGQVLDGDTSRLRIGRSHRCQPTGDLDMLAHRGVAQLVGVIAAQGDGCPLGDSVSAGRDLYRASGEESQLRPGTLRCHDSAVPRDDDPSSGHGSLFGHGSDPRVVQRLLPRTSSDGNGEGDERHDRHRNVPTQEGQQPQAQADRCQKNPPRTVPCGGDGSGNDGSSCHRNHSQVRAGHGPCP